MIFDDFEFHRYTYDQTRQLHFFIPMKPNSLYISEDEGREVPVECKITERKYKLYEHDAFWPYKVEFEPVDPDLISVFGRKEFYGCDFEDLVNKDYSLEEDTYRACGSN